MTLPAADRSEVRAPGLRPTWAEVDLAAIRSNLKAFRRRMPRRVKTLFVVKADAYGHGAARVAALAEAEGADWLGVSSVEEGAALRKSGVKLPVLVLGSLYPFESFREAARLRLTPTVASPEAARRLVEFAAKHRFRLDCHLKLDTGMNRIGMSSGALLKALEVLSGSARVRVGGVYTHLAGADSDPEFTSSQLAAFKSAVQAAARRGYATGLRHAANSAAALRWPAARWDLVRPGLALYGLLSPFMPALSLKSRVVFVKHVRRGARIGYGGTFRARRNLRIATLPVGYADGFPRALSNKGQVLLGGRRAPIVGAVSMDMMTVDATALPSCHVGDTAVLIGPQGRDSLSARELAQKAQTIPYEIVCRLAARVPRVYVGGPFDGAAQGGRA